MTNAGLAHLATEEKVYRLDLSRTSVSDRGLVHLTGLRRLRRLDLRHLQLTEEWLKRLARLTTLDELHLSYCSDLRDEWLSHLVALPHLLVLNLHGSRVTDLGLAHLAKLAHLQVLSLSGNKVTDIGLRHVAGLKHLRVLHLEGTRVTDVGLGHVSTLVHLRELDLRQTRITDAGLIELNRLKELRKLAIAGTKVSLPLQVTRCRKATVLLRYFLEAKTGRPLLEVKIPILGLGRLGKTQLCRRLAPQCTEELIAPFEPNARSTHGFTIRRMSLQIPRQEGAKECVIHLYDFGGQVEMHGTHRFFLADKRNVYVILVSARLNRQANRLDYWLRMVKYYGGGAPAIIVISHCDEKPGALDLVNPERTQSRALECLDPMALEQEHGIPIEVVDGYSNHTGAHFDEIRDALRRSIAKLDEVFQVPFAPAFFEVRDWLAGRPPNALLDCKRFDTYLTVTNEFRPACIAVGQHDQMQQDIWLQLMRNLGLLHFVGDRPEIKRNPEHGLADFLFNPKWVKKPVYGVVRSLEASERNGILSEHELHAILIKRGVAADVDRRRLLALMQASELIFKIRGGDTSSVHYLITDQVPSSKPSVHLDWANDAPKKHVRWEFPFLPAHLLPQLLGRWWDQRDISLQYFKDEIVLCHPRIKNCRVRLKADIAKHLLELEYAAQRKTDSDLLHARIETEIESILDPEAIRRKGGEILWRECEVKALPTMLSHEEESSLNQISQALLDIHDKTRNTTGLFNPLNDHLRNGFQKSINLSNARRLAYRACFTFALSKIIADEVTLETVFPLPVTHEQMLQVGRWLKDNLRIKELLKGDSSLETLEEQAGAFDALRKSYEKALEKTHEKPHGVQMCNLKRHAHLQERRRTDS